MTLGQQILIARKNKSLTQKELGDKIEISKQQLGLIERGVSNPKIETLKKISKILNVEFIISY
jgi:transcriptional regulator with XRE-family HTH domain